MSTSPYPRYCVLVAAVALASAVVSGQSPRGFHARAPAPLLPADQAWLVTLPAPPSASGAIDRERVFVPLESGRVIALERESGETVWMRDLESAVPPVVGESTLFVATPGNLHALDPATGSTQWSVPLPQPPSSAPVLTGDLIVVPTGSADVTAFRGSDGQPLWMRSLGAEGRLTALAAGGNVVYATSADARLLALNAGSGDLRWQHELEGTLSPPVVARDRVFVGSSAKAFYAFHPDSGRLAWRWPTGGTVVGAAADEDEGLVYVVSLDNLLRALNRGNGNQRWRQTLATRPVGPPVAFGGIVAVFGVTQAILTFGARAGAPGSTYSAPPAQPGGPPPVLQGAPLIDPVLRPFRVGIIVLLRDGRAVGLRPTAMQFREEPLVPFSTVPGRALPTEGLPQDGES